MAIFTLQPRRWYAMDYFFPYSGDRQASPIWISDLIPLFSGSGKLAIKFWHANSGEDERDKDYTLRVIRRTEGYLLAERVCGTEPPLVILTEINAAWFKQNFPVPTAPEAGDDMQKWCDAHIRQGQA